jgi:lactoylglutathione lyase
MITGIGHVAFRVTDLDRALAFYCGVLGLREAFRLDREGEPSPWIVYLQLAPGRFIELFSHAEGAVAPRGRSAGYNHYCLEVDDMRVTLRELEARGLRGASEPTLGLDRNWQCWLTDPDGNRIELMQIMPGSPQAAAAAAWPSMPVA